MISRRLGNWFFIAESADYFGSDVATSPVAHYWSLSIEEQFYLLWPVLLTGLSLAARRFGAARQAVTRGVVAIDLTGTLAEDPLVPRQVDRSLPGALAMLDDLLPDYGTVLIVAEPGYGPTPDGKRGSMLRAYDKRTGREVAALQLPAPQTGSPMTYQLNGRQYLVIAVGGNAYPGELIAYRVPE